MTKKLHGSTYNYNRLRGNYICKSLAAAGKCKTLKYVLSQTPEKTTNQTISNIFRALYEYRYVHIYDILYKIDLSRVKRKKLQCTHTQTSRQHTRTKQTTLHEQNTCKYTHLHVPLLDLPAHRSQRNARATQREMHLAQSTPAEPHPSPLHSPNAA